MVTATTIFIGILTIQYVLTMPNGEDEIRKFLELENDEPKLDDKPYLKNENEEIVETKKVQGQRQKRWHEPIPYNFQLPFVRPYTTESDFESSLASIRSSLDQLLNVAKSPPPPPPPSIFPVYVPVYIPQPMCGCNPVRTEHPPSKAPEQPTTNQEPSNETIPDLSDRFPEMEDERQNWGLVINNTVTDYDDEDDGSRPISLGPISSSSDGTPSVEHGSSQADVNSPVTPIVASPPRAVASTVNSPQRNCDNAVLSCCLGPDKTYECIQSRDCRDETLKQNPCDPQKLLYTITRLQSYYN